MKTYSLLLCLLLALPGWAQSDLTAEDIIRLSDQQQRGETAQGQLKMTIVRPEWTRELTMKTWSKGEEYSLILVTQPARDKGVAFLKREKELWNWQPSISRTIKMPPSMMMQSWMGSDFKNDDLIRESSIIHDYMHALAGDEVVDGLPCYKVVLTPLPDAPVIWGQVIIWIDKTDYLQLKVEFYDEEEFLVSTMYGKEVRQMGNRKLPSKLIVEPADEEGHQTVVEYVDMVFDERIDDSFFSIKNLKRVR